MTADDFAKLLDQKLKPVQGQLNKVVDTVSKITQRLGDVEQNMATKKELKRVEQNMATKKELKQVSDKVASLDQRIEQVEQKMVTKQDLEEKFNDFREEVIQHLQTSEKNIVREMASSNDELMKEVKAMREDQAAHQMQHEDITDIDNRLTKVEKHLSLPQ